MEQKQGKENAEQQTEDTPHRIIFDKIDVWGHPCHGQTIAPAESLS